jgi:hypothetical protein
MDSLLAADPKQGADVASMCVARVV